MIDLDWLRRTIVGVLRLDDAPFEAQRAAPDGVARGITFLVTLALAVGLVMGAAQFLGQAGTDPAGEVERATSSISGIIDMLATAGLFGDPETADQIKESIRAGLAMGTEVADVAQATTPAPSPIPQLFRAVGAWLSWPFSWLALWLTWGVITLIFARLLGGTATIQQMLATTALVAAPHLLDALGWIPCFGALIGVLAWIWAAVVFVKATAVANRISVPAALAAVFLPLLIPVAIGICGLFTIGLIVGQAVN
jgi:hypothetical protein